MYARVSRQSLLYPVSVGVLFLKIMSSTYCRTQHLGAKLRLDCADPFKLVGGDDMDEEMGGGFQSNLVHIRLQQRTGRKTLTTVQGLADVFDKKKV